MRISLLGERELIKKIAAVVGGVNDREAAGIGDDAALTRISAGLWLVTAKDMLVEGVHFLLPQTAPADLGYKSLAVNLSDLAAMGARPKNAFVALALHPETDSEFVLDFFRGMKELALQFDVAISGGDLVQSPGPLAVSVTVQGEVLREKALLRSGGLPGDVLCTTGPWGASAAGLLLLRENYNCPEDVREAALQAHFRPRPRVEEALWLVKSGAVRAAIDLSDGPLKDILEIMDASGCGAQFFARQIPVHPAAADVARLAGLEPLELALNGGEDYELLCAVPERIFDGLACEYAARFGTPLYPCGVLTEKKNLEMITDGGKREKISFTGYRHF